MNFYEHTIIARQDTSQSQLKQIEEKYSNLVLKNDGKIVKTGCGELAEELEKTGYQKLN